jgi:hypothetical protein
MPNQEFTVVIEVIQADGTKGELDPIGVTAAKAEDAISVAMRRLELAGHAVVGGRLAS